ncbi:hypothetical protein IWZ01DRAFT_266573 [Phyllosticta capitalensis]
MTARSCRYKRAEISVLTKIFPVQSQFCGSVVGCFLCKDPWTRATTFAQHFTLLLFQKKKLTNVVYNLQSSVVSQQASATAPKQLQPQKTVRWPSWLWRQVKVTLISDSWWGNPREFESRPHQQQFFALLLTIWRCWGAEEWLVLRIFDRVRAPHVARAGDGTSLVQATRRQDVLASINLRLLRKNGWLVVVVLLFWYLHLYHSLGTSLLVGSGLARVSDPNSLQQHEQVPVDGTRVGSSSIPLAVPHLLTIARHVRRWPLVSIDGRIGRAMGGAADSDVFGWHQTSFDIMQRGWTTRIQRT